VAREQQRFCRRKEIDERRNEIIEERQGGYGKVGLSRKLNFFCESSRVVCAVVRGRREKKRSHHCGSRAKGRTTKKKEEELHKQTLQPT
jgi:hypothetical protein